MAAADLMLAYGTGVLRTLPSAPDGAVARLRRSAQALGIDWPHHVPYAQVIRSLDPRDPHHAAFLQECTTLLRGAGYTVFTGGNVPEHTVHAAVADAYTHCTAPLRRLVDRYAGELCLAAVGAADVPDWVLAALDALPKEMAEGTRRANTVERECVDLVEAALLKDRVGDVFDATVVDVEDDQPAAGTVHLTDPAVVAPVKGGAPCPWANASGSGSPRPTRAPRRWSSPRPEGGGSATARPAGSMVGTADEPGGRPRGDPRILPRNVRAPQGRVVGNAHPG